LDLSGSGSERVEQAIAVFFKLLTKFERKKKKRKKNFQSMLLMKEKKKRKNVQSAKNAKDKWGEAIVLLMLFYLFALVSLFFLKKARLRSTKQD
jgi:hypothetical protein